MITFPRALQRSFSSKPVELVLFSTENCSLCVHFHRQLKNYVKKHPNVTVIEKNLAAQPPEVIEVRVLPNLLGFDVFPYLFFSIQPLQKFKFDIPVLVDGEKIVLKHRFIGAILN